MMNSRQFKLFLPLIIFTLIAAVFYVLQSRSSSGSYDPSELPSPLVGEYFPEFSLPDLQQAIGDGSNTFKIVNQDIIEGPALVNVWATWCVTCRYEHPYLLQLQREGIRIYGINYKDENSAAIKWLDRLGNPYLANIIDSEGRLGLDLGVYGAPETYIIDAQGKIAYRHAGELNERVWRKKIAPLGISW